MTMTYMTKAHHLFQSGKEQVPPIEGGTLLEKNTEHFLANFPHLYSHVYEQKPTMKVKDKHWTNIQYPFNSQVLIEEALNHLENAINAHLLYVYSQERGRTIQAVLYTYPTLYDMTTYMLRSDNYGAIDSIDITIYDDITDMFSTLNKDLATQKKLRRHFLEKRTDLDFVKDFI